MNWILQQRSVAFIVCMMIAGCSGGINRPPQKASRPPTPKPAGGLSFLAGGLASVINGRFSVPSPHGLILDFKTPQGQADVQSQLVHLNSVDGVLYQQGKPSIHVRAPRVSVDLRRQIVVLESGVTADSLLRAAGFSSDRLEWRWAQRNGLTATGHVRFHQGAAVVSSGRLVGDVDLRRAVLTEQPVAAAPEIGV